MAVANPCVQKEWKEWKEEMEENRRRRWRERVSRYSEVVVSDEEEDGEEEETEGSEDSEEQEVSEGEKNEACEGEEEEEEEDEIDIMESEEIKGEEQNEVQRERNEKEEGKREEEEDSEVDEIVDMEEKDEENEAEGEVEGNDKMDKDEEMEVKKAEEREEEGGTEVEREEENKNGVEEKEGDVKEVKEMEEEQEEGDVETKKEVKENKVADVEEESEEEKEVESEAEREFEENEEEEVVDNEVTEEEESDYEEEEGGEIEFEREVKEAEELEKEKEEGESEVAIKVKENKMVDVEEEAEMEEVEKEVDDEVKESGERDEVEEEEAAEVEQLENEHKEGEHDFEREVKDTEELEEGEYEIDEVEDRQLMEEGQVEEEGDWEEEHQEQQLIGQQFREQIRRNDDEVMIPQNQECRRPEENDEEETLSDPVSDDEDSDMMGYEFECKFERVKNENKQYKDPKEDAEDRSWRTESNTSGEWTFKERKEEEEESEKFTDEERTVTESWIAQEEEFQDDHRKIQENEEEFTDDEEAEHSANEDADNYEDVIKIYCKDDYLSVLFGTLTEFRDSSLLTDLTLSTDDGKSFHVHSLVLAAVSFLIRKSLARRNVENDRFNERQDDDTSFGVHRWSISLGPEVDYVGLKAVVEFAYTGLISCLSKDTVHQIKATAESLDAPRVLDLCTEEEAKSTKTGGEKKKQKISATEQMLISLQSIKQMWMDRIGCDVILEALGGSLHVHRVILAVGSDYFRSMFTLGMRESHQSCVTLPFILSSELEVLIDCSYSGALPLSWKCVFEITSIALQLQYQPALSLCLNFLQQEINPNSCLDVISFAEAYELVQLHEIADDFVLRQFQKVACTSKFKDLPARQLLKYLNSHSLCVPSELVVFKAVVAWIQAKPRIRLRLAKELMKTIHFPLMTFKEFREVQSINIWSDQSLAELYEAIFEDFCSNEIAPQSQCRIYLPKESLVLIGGDQTFEDLGSRSISRELWFGNSLRNHTGIRKAMEWRKLGEMPEPARFRHEVAVLRGQVYVFGGKKYYGISDTLNSVYRYDPLQNSWESLAEMQEKRCSFSVVVLEGKIYAIGGHCEPDYMESVERYCPTLNSWSFTCPLDLPLSGHAAKVLQGQIFVSGGLSSDHQCLSSMFLYHPETGSTYLANMAQPRGHHCMETLGGCLYVAGGITTNEHMAKVDQLTCEVYSPESNSWTAFTPLPVPHVGAGSAVLEGKFYVLGGYSQEDYSDTTMVHRYDATTQRWENMGKMPGPNNDIRAFLLCLPTHYRL